MSKLPQDMVLDVLRGTAHPSLRKRAPSYASVTVHVLGLNDCTVQVGSRVVLQGATRERAVEEAEGQKRRLVARGINATVTIYD